MATTTTTPQTIAIMIHQSAPVVDVGDVDAGVLDIACGGDADAGVDGTGADDVAEDAIGPEWHKVYMELYDGKS